MTIENNKFIDIQQLYRDEKYMPLLPLLEEPFRQVKATYPGITEVNFQNLVNYALEWDSVDYWPVKAIEWLENGLLLSEDTVERLASLVNDMRVTPSVTARIDKLLLKSRSSISV